MRDYGRACVRACVCTINLFQTGETNSEVLGIDLCHSSLVFITLIASLDVTV